MSVPLKRQASIEPDGSPRLARGPRSPPIRENEFQPFILHRVVCSSAGAHAGHPSVADYLDAPRLFSGDSKASNLRGKNPIQETGERLLKKQDLIWIKNYICMSYHDSVAVRFERLRPPTCTQATGPLVAQPLYVLEADWEVAKPVSEELVIVAEDLRTKLEETVGAKTARLSTADKSATTSVVVDRCYTLLKSRPNILQQLECRMANLLQYVAMIFESDYRHADALFASGNVSKAHLAKLFLPNQMVVARHDGYIRAYLVFEWPCWNGDSLFLPSTCWEFDGQFWKHSVNLILPWKIGQRQILVTDLCIHPLQAAQDIEARLLKRGAMFWKCRDRRMVSYNRDPSTKQPTAKLRYMLDARTYHHLHKNTSSTNRVNNDYLSKEKHAADSPPDPVFQHLLPPTIPGFGFHDKKWNFIPVDDIDEELHWNVEAFDHLVLKSPKKDLIRALVTKHIASSNGNVNGSGNDVIANKGSGLILLLHGSPGTGKTLTAESVSELIQRPLYRITSGDMGTNAKEAEQYLESVLYLASVWRCVVLLDEADVFLEQRSQQDLEHNALVSVFLRMIEYYFSGILFLTTTRIGTLDGAFKSRVQLAVHYPPLDESSRRRVWSNFVNRLRLTRPDAKVDQILDNVDELARFNLNGREIRNSVTSATLLAEFRGQSLDCNHLMEVIGVSNEFERYLIETHGHTAAEPARDQRIRNK